jgi:hypothetical protein
MSVCRRSLIRYGKIESGFSNADSKAAADPESVAVPLRARQRLVERLYRAMPGACKRLTAPASFPFGGTGTQTFQSLRPAELDSAADQKEADNMSAWRTGHRPVFRGGRNRTFQAALSGVALR